MPRRRIGLAFLLFWRLAPAWVLVACSLTGCATAGSPDPVVDARLKQFEVAADRSGLYVYRTGESPVSTPANVIHVDGIAVGLTSRMRYVYVDLPPGPHAVTTAGDPTVPLRFDARPGSLTYVCEEVPTMRAQHLGTRLRLVDEAVGKAGVLQTSLAGDPFVFMPSTMTPAPQTLQVRVEDADGKAWTTAIDCEAVNDLGRWPFTAPGAVLVSASPRPLQIFCRAPEGMVSEPAELASSGTTRSENVAKGATAGAVVGGAVGVGLAIASFPIMGPLGVMFVAGGAVRGAEFGGLYGVLSEERPPAYPDSVVLKLKAVPAQPR